MINVVNWSATATATSESCYQITVTGEILPGYHIYDSQPQPNVNPTVITVSGEGITLGEFANLSQVQSEDGINIISDKALFTQEVELSGRSADINVNIEWMACTETACTPLDDIDIALHLGPEGHSSAWYAGLACGIIAGIILIRIGMKMFKKLK